MGKPRYIEKAKQTPITYQFILVMELIECFYFLALPAGNKAIAQAGSQSFGVMKHNIAPCVRTLSGDFDTFGVRLFFLLLMKTQKSKIQKVFTKCFDV